MKVSRKYGEVKPVEQVNFHISRMREIWACGGYGNKRRVFSIGFVMYSLFKLLFNSYSHKSTYQKLTNINLKSRLRLLLNFSEALFNSMLVYMVLDGLSFNSEPTRIV